VLGTGEVHATRWECVADHRMVCRGRAGRWRLQASLTPGKWNEKRKTG
jgi:hypothetical protein